MTYAIDPYARAGRTGFRLNVTEARRLRSDVRYQMGTTREDTPTVADLFAHVKRGDGDGTDIASPASLFRTVVCPA